MTAEPTVEIADAPDSCRYEIRVDGKLAGFSVYTRTGDDRIDFVHTEIFDEYEHHGLGGRLARGALDDARTRRLRVAADCPFIAKYLAEHQEYADLVA